MAEPGSKFVGLFIRSFIHSQFGTPALRQAQCQGFTDHDELLELVLHGQIRHHRVYLVFLTPIPALSTLLQISDFQLTCHKNF